MSAAAYRLTALALCAQVLSTQLAQAAEPAKESAELTDAAPALGALAAEPAKESAELTDAGPTDKLGKRTTSRARLELSVPMWFVAGVVDAGFPYFEPRGVVGYGLPRGAHLGVEAFPRVSATDVGGYVGLSASAPPVSLRLGQRFTYAPQRSFPLKVASYDRGSVEIDDGSRARFWSWEAALYIEPRLGPGILLSESAVGYLAGIPEERDVYSGAFRAVLGAPWVLYQRLGYLLYVGADDALGVGLVVDYLRDPERAATTWRGGLLVRLTLASDLEARGSFVPTWVGPDRLGLMGGDFSELGLRWWWSEPL